MHGQDDAQPALLLIEIDNIQLLRAEGFGAAGTLGRPLSCLILANIESCWVCKITHVDGFMLFAI